MQNTTFRDKTIWITGASSGIGEALAVAFARQGAHLVLSSRNSNELERVADRCQCTGLSARPKIEPFDMADHSHFPNLVKKVLEHSGRVDILINNAGIGQRSTALSCAPDVVRRMMEVNFFGPVFLTQTLLPSMIAQGSGRIVVISSILGKIHFPGRSTYGASKHALQGYFSTLRSELYGSGVGVTTICPGWIATGFSQNALTATGAPYEQKARKHSAKMSTEQFARKALQVIAVRRDEAIIGGKETIGVWASKLFPKIYDHFVRYRNEFTCTLP
ncbi:MAG TPA: SDR family oxidoreductase [Chitinispirillaceae bacterium]|nr:SDR family oxidoreductase [Chitinispirillaceae bacterium]